jgi:phospholipid/cholesterol/gamma-HCH transport system substrate-binding protein
MTALAEKRETLTDLVGNADQAAEGIVSENESFSRVLQRLPDTLRRGNSTFVNLRATLTDLDVLVAESKPATKDLARFLRELRPLVSAARPTIRDLRLAIRRPGQRQRPRRADAQGAAPAARRLAVAAQHDDGAAQVDPGARLRPAVHARAHRLPARLRQLVGQLRRQRPLRAHPAALQHLLLHRQRGRRPAAAAGPRRPARRPADRLQQALPGRCDPGGGRRLAPFKDDGLDCDERLVLPGP